MRRFFLLRAISSIFGSKKKGSKKKDKEYVVNLKASRAVGSSKRKGIKKLKAPEALVAKKLNIPLRKKRKALPKSSKVTPKESSPEVQLRKLDQNPIISPLESNGWESWQTFNPAVVEIDGRVHFLYRAIGEGGMSVLGYASSGDGVHIDERSREPAYIMRTPLWQMEPRFSKYRTSRYTSGGGIGGCEDPRITRIEGTVYMVYVAFDGHNPPRLALTYISVEDLLEKRWNWAPEILISLPGVVDKSGCLFPEKIDGKYVMLHRIFPDILLDLEEDLRFEHHYLKGEYRIPASSKGWDSRKVGAGAPPIKTDQGWLLITYGVDDANDKEYKMGAMLLDVEQPWKVISRTKEPILEPSSWYEYEGHKGGVVYPCGAAVLNGTLHVYYGGADSFVCVATAPLKEFVDSLRSTGAPKISSTKKVVKKKNGVIKKV